MPSIQGSGQPLAFRADPLAGLEPVAEREHRTGLRTAVRSLEGMQKEALVSVSSADALWRMVSDEGPYLDGTDLAPFPLAFFTAGMQFSLMSELVRLARAASVSLGTLRIVQDNFYSMEGSFIRGDALGGALPAEVLVQIESGADRDRVCELARLAEASCPAHAVMRDPLDNTFSLTLNGRGVPLTGVRPATRAAEDPLRHFDSLRPAQARGLRPDAIRKTVSAASPGAIEN